MFLRRATAASREGDRQDRPLPQTDAHALAAGSDRAWRLPWAAGATAVVGALGIVGATGCGAPNPRILDATEEARGIPSAQLGNVMTEQDKIKALIAEVRRSEHVFVHDDIERSGEATADKLQLLLERDPTGVRSAREFIERIAAPVRTDEPPDRVRLGPEPSMLAKDWYHARLAELEGRPAPPVDPMQAREAEAHARRLRILDALTLVERSELRFVSPPRKVMPKAVPDPIDERADDRTRREGPKPRSPAIGGPKRKPKRKEYTGPQFADMLRKKWEFLGADIHDLDTFIEEIASDSFASMVRYRVILEDGREQDFGHWLRGQLEGERATVAQGGAP